MNIIRTTIALSFICLPMATGCVSGTCEEIDGEVICDDDVVYDAAFGADTLDDDPPKKDCIQIEESTDVTKVTTDENGNQVETQEVTSTKTGDCGDEGAHEKVSSDGSSLHTAWWTDGVPASNSTIDDDPPPPKKK